MTETVTITGLRRVRDPKANRGGAVILAHFDCEARGLVFAGCAFVRTARGGLAAWLPRLDGKEGERRFVAFADDSLRHAMMLHAREAYRALGGTDAETIGRIVPAGPTPPDHEHERDRAGLGAFLGEPVHG